MTIASTPRCGREPCAARPVTSSSSQTNPLCATTSSSSVGSVTTAASAAHRPSTSWIPRLAYSSSATAATTTSPARPSSRRVATGDQRGGDAGLHVVGAASIEPVAVDPRCERLRHSRRRRPCRGVRRASSVRPPPVPRARTTTLGRPGSRSIVSASRPFASAHCETNRAISRLARAAGTSDGFTESIATSSASRSVRSSMAHRSIRVGASRAAGAAEASPAPARRAGDTAPHRRLPRR